MIRASSPWLSQTPSHCWHLSMTMVDCAVGHRPHRLPALRTRLAVGLDAQLLRVLAERIEIQPAQQIVLAVLGQPQLVALEPLALAGGALVDRRCPCSRCRRGALAIRAIHVRTSPSTCWSLG